MKKRIVVMTGSFNPLTKAHVDVLTQAVDALDAEKGLFVTSSENYLKRKTIAKAKTRTPFRLPEEVRIQLLKSVKNDDPRLEYGGTEDNNPSGTTSRALKRLLKEYPGYELYYICGADKLTEIPKWTGKRRIMLKRPALIISKPFILSEKASEYTHRACDFSEKTKKDFTLCVKNRLTAPLLPYRLRMIRLKASAPL